MRPALTLVFTALVACGDKDPDDSDPTPPDDSAVEGDTDTDTDTDTDADADTDTDTDTDPGELGDVWANLDEDHCEDIAGFEDQIGASSYFIGEFEQVGSAWAGQEFWVLFVTSEWEAAGGSDCQIVWDVSGSSSAAGACSSCDYGVRVDATLNAGQTTCPEGLYKGEESYSVTYGVDEATDGTAEIYFASSGNLLGRGYGNGTAFNYVSDVSCKWF